METREPSPDARGIAANIAKLLTKDEARRIAALKREPL